MSYKKLADNVSVNSATDLESNSSRSGLLPIQDISIGGEITYLQEPEDAPQGRHLGLFSTTVLFVSRILGSGFLAISSGMYNDCGQSPFFFFLSWIIAAALAFSGLYVYLELGALIPRSGGTKVFLEFLYERPFMLVSVTISLFSVMFGFTILNVLVFGEYFLHALGVEPNEWQTRITGLVFLYLACAIHGFSVHHGVKVQNFIGMLKLVLAALIVCTGIWVSFFPSSITHIECQLKTSEFFPVKSTISLSSFASAVIKGTFAYGGWNSVHTVTNEIKDPVRTLKIAGPTSLIIITLTYIFINIAYLVVIPDAEIVTSGQLIGSLLFEKIFGYHVGRQFLTLSSALCTGGNVFVVLYTISRVSQEVFREGFLPGSQFMASNWPGDAPLPTLLLSCILSTIVVLCSPRGDVYNYVVALESYPQQIFIALCALGIFIIRKRYPGVRAPIRSTNFGTLLVILISAYLVIIPLFGKQVNPKGLENWIPYPYLGLICLFLCVIYWFCMFVAGPYMFNYTLEAEEIEQQDGLVVKKWLKLRGAY